MDFSRISSAHCTVSIQAVGFNFSIELVMASRSALISSIWTPLRCRTTVKLASLATFVDVQRMASRSVTVFKIEAKNLAVSQLAMSAAGDVWSLRQR